MEVWGVLWEGLFFGALLYATSAASCKLKLSAQFTFLIMYLILSLCGFYNPFIVF